MKRKLEADLTEWNKTNERPLLLCGPRESGKTGLVLNWKMRVVDKWGHSTGLDWQDNIVRIDLAIPSLAHGFRGDLGPKRLAIWLNSALPSVMIKKKKINFDYDVLFLDNLHVTRKADPFLLHAAKDMPGLRVIAAWTLTPENSGAEILQSANLKKLAVHPMGFDEYLWALDQIDLYNRVVNKYQFHDNRISPVFHEQLLLFYHDYLSTGGMPRAVAYFRENGDYGAIRPVQKTILDSYLADIAATGDRKMIECLDSIPAQLGKKNKKFQYRAIKQGASAPRYSDAIERLIASGLALKCIKVSDAVFPLADHAETDSFKLYLNDTGLLCAKFGMESFELLSPRLSGTIQEALAENYCASELHARGYPLYYWQSGNSAEIQFLIEKDGAVIPVEVKANARIKSRSLSVFVERYNPPYAIQISDSGFSFENGKQTVPFYAVFCL